MTRFDAGSKSRPRQVVVDVALLGVAYLIYTALRNAVPDRRSLALRNAWRLVHVEALSGLAPEHRLNAALAVHRGVATVFDYYYASLHFVVVLAVLGFLYWRRPDAARRWAGAWYVMNLLGLVGFWLLPTAPPRLLAGAGFVDTVARFHTWGSWGAGAVASASNQYAAFPSLHVGWALWAALAVGSLTRRRLLRTVALLYPLMTALVVLGTANHYLIDIAAGVAVCLAGFAVPAAVRAAVRMAGSIARGVAARVGADRQLPSFPGAGWRTRGPALILILITVTAVALGVAAAVGVGNAGRRRHFPGATSTGASRIGMAAVLVTT